MPARRRGVALVRAPIAAVAFLTRVPVGSLVALDGDDVARGAPLFPFVGAAVGAAVGLVAVGADAVLPPLVAAALAVAAEAVLTGAIHLDAAADTADALGAATRERALEVMREPTIGSFGATALLVLLLAKTVALASLLAEERALAALAAAYAVGRAAPVALGWALPYARTTAGGGRALTDATTGVGALVAVGVAAVLAVVLAGLDGVFVVVGGAVAAVSVGAVARRRFGGATGDVLGAVTEVATVAAVVAAVAVA